MPNVIQEKLILWILRPLSRVTEKIPPAVREAAASLSIAGIIFLQFADGAGLYTGHTRVNFAIDCFLIGILIFCGLAPDLKPVRFSPVLMGCWLVMILSMILTSMLVDIIDMFVLLHVIEFLVVFPVIYLVWSGPGFDRLLSLAIRGVMISFLVFTVISALFYPLIDVNYASFFGNRNWTGMYLISVFVCLLCFIFAQDRYSPRVFAADAAIGFAIATLYYTNCRTAIFAAAACFLASSALQIFIHREKWRRVLLFQLLPVIAAAIVLLPSAAYLYHGGYWLSNAVQTALTPDAPDAPDVPDIPVTEVMETMKKYNASRFRTEGLEENTESLSPAQDAVNNLTAGRVRLWVIRLREIGLLGNPSDKVLYTSTGEDIGNSAHFTALQYAYDYGAAAGISFLLMNILAGLSSIWFAATRRDIKYSLAPFAIAIAYGAESVMESLGDPIGAVPSLLYFLSLAPLFAKAVERLPEEKELA